MSPSNESEDEVYEPEEFYDEEEPVQRGHLKHGDGSLREFIAAKKIAEGTIPLVHQRTPNDDLTAVRQHLDAFEKCCGSFYRVIKKKLLED